MAASLVPTPLFGKIPKRGVGTCGYETRTRLADSSDELAVLGQSLNSVGCSLSLESLTRRNMTSSAQSTASHPLSSR